MDGLILLGFWVVSFIIVIFMTRAREPRTRFAWALIVWVLGPIALPLVFFAMPAKEIERAPYDDIDNDT